MQAIFVYFAKFCIVLIVASSGAAAAAAQANPAEPTILREQEARIAGFKRQLDQAEKRATEIVNDDEALVARKLEADELSRTILRSGVEFRPRLSEINSRVETLGPAPAAGAVPEPAVVTEERNRLTAEKGEINALLGELEKLSLRAAKLSDQFANKRRALFSAQLFSQVPLADSFTTSVFRELGGEISGFGRKVSSWARFAIKFKLSSLLGASFLALFAALLLVTGARRVLPQVTADRSTAAPSNLNKLAAAFWLTVIPAAGLGIFLIVADLLFNRFAIFTGTMPQFFRALFNVIFVVFFVQRLANAILRPSGPEWRLVSVHTRAATLLVYIVTALAVIVSADFLLGVIGNIESSSLGLTVGKSLLAAFLTGSLLIAAATLKPFSAEDGTPRHWPTLLRVALYALGVFPIAAALLGYVGLAQYVSQQVVINGALIITLYVGFLTARAVGAEGAFAQTRIGQSIGRRFGLAEQTVDQMGMIAGIAINVVAVAVIVPLILLQIGFQTADLKSWLYGVVSEIKIGSISISLIGVVTGMIVFIAGYFLTRWFQSWLDSTVMARGKVEPGVRNSIRTAVGYAGIALAALFGISAAGINLSNLALVAGALSLGIGFGLQNVVSNFVSGLILLAERPFKVGDWIEAGTVSGTVKRINVRATEIETFQRQTIIMPNSELINAAVGNWTHRNKLARGDIRIGVAYGTDPKMVRAILLEIAHTHPRVLKNPEPFVIFANFGESSLDFELRFFLSDVSLRQEVATELRFAIVEAFEAKGIEIPFPQRDLNITSSSISALAKALAKEETGEPKPLKRQTKKPSVVEKAPVKSRSGRRYRELD